MFSIQLANLREVNFKFRSIFGCDAKYCHICEFRDFKENCPGHTMQAVVDREQQRIAQESAFFENHIKGTFGQCSG